MDKYELAEQVIDMLTLEELLETIEIDKETLVLDFLLEEIEAFSDQLIDTMALVAEEYEDDCQGC